MDWTGGLDWWTDIKNNFYAINETHLPVGVTNHWTELDWTHKKVRNKLINHRKLGGGALKLYVINLREQHPMLLHFTSQETESGSVDETYKKKRICIVLDWIAH